jgi:hypothetical protein
MFLGKSEQGRLQRNWIVLACHNLLLMWLRAIAGLSKEDHYLPMGHGFDE